MNNDTAQIITFIALLATGVGLVVTGRAMDRLEKRVACLEHPAGGASSVAAERIRGRFAIVQPPTKTRICP